MTTTNERPVLDVAMSVAHAGDDIFEGDIKYRLLAKPTVVEFRCPVESETGDTGLLRALADYLDNEHRGGGVMLMARINWCEETDEWHLLATIDD